MWEAIRSVFRSGAASLPADDVNATDGPRIVICQESREGTHTVLYDSDRLPAKRERATPIPTQRGGGASPNRATPNPNYRTANGAGPPQRHRSHGRRSQNIKLLSELMFGSIPLSLERPSSKIHFLQQENEVLVTRVFRYTHTSRPTDKQGSMTPQQRGRSHDTADARSRRNSVPVKPFQPIAHRAMFAVGVLFTETLFEGVGLGNHPATNQPSPLSFVQSNFTQIDFFLQRLQLVFSHCVTECVMRGVAQLSNARLCFGQYGLQEVVSLQAGMTELCRSVQVLLHAPRLQRPLWPLLSAGKGTKQHVIDFLEDLTALHVRWSQRSTAFFLASTITCVLQQHRSWLATVSSHHTPPVAIDADVFNMYGTHEGLLARTIVTGRDKSLVESLLFVLSYFIRSLDLSPRPPHANVVCSTVLESCRDGIAELQSNVVAELLPVDDTSSSPSSNNDSSDNNNNDNNNNNNAPSTPRLEIVVLPSISGSIAPSSSATANTPSGSMDARVPSSQAVGAYAAPVEEDRVAALYAGYCARYSGEFILMGLPSYNFYPTLERDLRAQAEIPHPLLNTPGGHGMSSSVVADTDKCLCNVISYSNKPPTRSGMSTTRSGMTVVRAVYSKRILSMLFEVHGFWELGLPSDVCAQYIEDTLQELVHKGQLLCDLLNRGDGSKMTIDGAIHITGMDRGDVELVLSIAFALDPSLAQQDLGRDFRELLFAATDEQNAAYDVI
eukprot:TRINITY_DN5975_c0_g1_i1.p1 TRINITY_DN5975_c0_g1~~TRINITY_DN5975_c0_g1_i1.p1  ORF type:complete len:726 (+),score=115.60 TRINITY_DN5975_c0_g1_i1:446-2623(+)